MALPYRRSASTEQQYRERSEGRWTRISAATTSINRTVSPNSDLSRMVNPEGSGRRLLLLARPAAVQEDASLRKPGEDQLGRRRAIEVGHIAVEQPISGAKLSTSSTASPPVGGLDHDLHTWHDPEWCTQYPAHGLLVVGKHKPDQL